MKDTHKYSILIYIMIPVLAAVWPALIFAVYLPDAQEKIKNDISAYSDANNLMLDILLLSPERIEPDDPNKQKIEFSYDRVIDEVVSICKISPSKCKWNTGTIVESKASKSQSASVRLTGVDITSIAKFLSIIQSSWPKLVCNSIKLDKKENIPDEWDVLLDFKYFYTAID